MFDDSRENATCVTVEGTARMLFKSLSSFFLFKIMHCWSQRTDATAARAAAIHICIRDVLRLQSWNSKG